MQELETLLNSLIQQGWKPKDREVVSIKLDKEFTKSEGKTVFYCNCKEGFGFYVDLRWLVSLESGLWQFVCENELVPYQTSGQIIKRYVNETVGRYSGNILEGEVISSDLDYEYRLLESALVPEDKLGKFLIDNIKIK